MTFLIVYPCVFDPAFNHKCSRLTLTLIGVILATLDHRRRLCANLL